MKDIVERLREWAEEDVRAIARDMPTMGLKIEPGDIETWGDLMDEAADEIGKLRAQINAWEAHARQHGCLKIETVQ